MQFQSKFFTFIATGAVLAALVVLLGITFYYRTLIKLDYLKKREKMLQDYLNKANDLGLNEHYCQVVVGPLGSYLKFVFTVKNSNLRFSHFPPFLRF